MPRPLTAAEKPIFLSAFPLLDVDFTIVTDEPSTAYNCISWTVGVTNFWHWPGSSLANFDTFYGQFGLVRVTKGYVAAWGFANNNMTHGCISGPTHGPCWESKCGSLARIQHCLNELNGPSYGHVIAYYRRRRLFPPWIKRYLTKLMKERWDFTKDEKEFLRELIKEIPDGVKKQFADKFAAWKRTWMKGAMAFSSNPYSRTEVAEYRELIKMGDRILPLLAEKLMDEKNFLALPAFEALQKTKKNIVRIDPGDEKILEGEQGRAYATLKKYFKNS
jgi:hypothetical protein